MQPKVFITINQNNAEYNVVFRVVHLGTDETKNFKCATLPDVMVEIERRIQVL